MMMDSLDTHPEDNTACSCYDQDSFYEESYWDYEDEDPEPLGSTYHDDQNRDHETDSEDEDDSYDSDESLEDDQATDEDEETSMFPNDFSDLRSDMKTTEHSNLTSPEEDSPSSQSELGGKRELKRDTSIRHRSVQFSRNPVSCLPANNKGMEDGNHCHDNDHDNYNDNSGGDYTQSGTSSGSGKRKVLQKTIALWNLSQRRSRMIKKDYLKERSITALPVVHSSEQDQSCSVRGVNGEPKREPKPVFRLLSLPNLPFVFETRLRGRTRKRSLSFPLESQRKLPTSRTLQKSPYLKRRTLAKKNIAQYQGQCQAHVNAKQTPPTKKLNSSSSPAKSFSSSSMSLDSSKSLSTSPENQINGLKSKYNHSTTYIPNFHLNFLFKKKDDLLSKRKATQQVFGVPLKTLVKHQKMRYETSDFVPNLVQNIVTILLPHVATEGIFRIPGNVMKVNTMITRLNEDDTLELKIQEKDDLHMATTLLKRFFQELPKPLLTYRLYPRFIATQSNKSKNSDGRRRALEKLVGLLPMPNRRTLQTFLRLLSEISRSSQSRMTPSALGTCVGQELVRQKNKDPNSALIEARLVQSLVADLISFYPSFDAAVFTK